MALVNLKEIQQRLESVIKPSSDLIGASQYPDLSGLDSEVIQAEITRLRAAIEQSSSTDSPYFKEMQAILTGKDYHGEKLRKLLGVA